MNLPIRTVADSLRTTPTKVGRYQILGELGRGTMGQVYRGFDPNIGRNVAIKTIPLEPVEPELHLRFRYEAQAAGILSHPNIVTIYDAGADEGLLYIAMELVHGETLQQVLSSGPIPLEQVLSIVEQVSAALHHAHGHGIVHRDIKPANIMIQAGMVKVTDFGVAKISTAEMTGTGQILGTPAYLAPEVIKGAVADHRSDIFSLGVTLYEMLTGIRPFAGDSISTVIYRVLSEQPQPPGIMNPLLPSGLNDVVLKALSKDPGERYQSCLELMADVKIQSDFANNGKAIVPLRSVIEMTGPAETVLLDRTKLELKPLAEKSTPLCPPVGLRKKMAWAAAAVAGILLLPGMWWQSRPSSGHFQPTASPALSSPATSARDSGNETSSAVGTLPPAAVISTRQQVAPSGSFPVPSISVKGGSERRIAAALPMGRVAVHTRPQGARILVNGEDTSYRSPVNFALAPGKYRITTERRGSVSETREVLVRQSQTAHLKLDLKTATRERDRFPFW